MSTIDSQTLLQQLKWRYATKQFDKSKLIPPDILAALEEALVLSPSSFGLQPWKFLLITNPEVRAKLQSLSWGQSQIVDASHLVVFLVKSPLTPADVRRFIERTAEVHGTTVDSYAGYEKMINGFAANFSEAEQRAWSSRQLYLAFGNFLTCAALLGVDACPVEGLDPAGYDKALGLEGSGYFTVAACPIGYRLEGDKYAALPKVRFHPHHVIQRIE